VPFDHENPPLPVDNTVPLAPAVKHEDEDEHDTPNNPFVVTDD
jgi:hypothetical protein